MSRKASVSRVSEKIPECRSIIDLVGYTGYKDIKPVEKQLKKYTADAFKGKIIDAISKLLQELCDFTDDMPLTKKAAADLNINMTIDYTDESEDSK